MRYHAFALRTKFLADYRFSYWESPPLFRTLSRKFKIEGLAEALAEGIFTGHPDMPEFVFEPDEVGAIIEYLKSIQQR